MVQRAGVGLPPLYALGFRNNNCIPCVKAQSLLIGRSSARRFLSSSSAVRLSRELKVRLVKTTGVDGPRRRIYIDEVALDQAVTEPIQPSCDFLCHLAEADL